MEYIIAFKDNTFYKQDHGSVFVWRTATRFTSEMEARHIASIIGGAILAILPS